MKPYELKRISGISIIFNVLSWVMCYIAETELLTKISYTFHDIFTASALVVMLIVLIMIPYWLYRFILYIIDKKKNIWLPINVCALVCNFISYTFFSYIVYKPFVNWLIIICLLVFFIRKVIWKLKPRIIAAVTFLLICVFGLAVLFSPYYNSFDTMSEYDKETFYTKFGDKITFVYEEYNFPDSSCSLTITDSECEEPVYLGSDPPEHHIQLREITQVGNNNIYLSNGIFLIKNTETKEFKEHKIAEIIPEDASEAYERCKEILKVFVCSGNIDWVVDYAESFIMNGDVDVINTVINIGNADIILSDEPNWVDADSHINAMYTEQISAMRPALYDKNQDEYNAIEAKDAVEYCKDLIEKYDLKYIGENTIHDNCRDRDV